MPSWSDLSAELIKPIPEMADSLSTELCDASDVKCIHFEDLVKEMGPKGYTPKCVDSMAVSGNRAYLIEFKPIPSTGGDDISDSLVLKALESAVIYLRFLHSRYGCKNLGLIIVTQDPRQEFAKAVAKKAGLHPGSTLDRYRKHDVNNDELFFDTVELMNCEQFIRFAHKHLMSSYGYGSVASE